MIYTRYKLIIPNEHDVDGYYTKVYHWLNLQK